MVEMVAYYPERHLRFLEFRQECDVLEAVAARFRELRALGLTEEAAFYNAWAETHPCQLGIMPEIGANAFYAMVRVMVNRAHMFLDYQKSEFLRPIAKWIKHHNAVASQVNPAKLLALLEKGIDRPGTRVHAQVRWEAKRNLALALQFVAMELADPEEWIAEDLSQVEDLSRSQLFAPVDLTDVFVVYKVHRDHSNRVIGQPSVFLHIEWAEAHRLKEEAAAQDGEYVHLATYECRTVQLSPDEVLFVHNDERRKTPFWRLVKLQDGSELRDARGTRYVVVAVQTKGRPLRTGEEADAENLMKFSRLTLWSGDPLYEVPVIPNPHRKRHADYRDFKLVGRIRVTRHRRTVCAFVEQIVMALGHYVNQERATDALNHEIRRAEQLTLPNPNIPDHEPPARLYWPEAVYHRLRWDEATMADLRAYWIGRYSPEAEAV